MLHHGLVKFAKDYDILLDLPSGAWYRFETRVGVADESAASVGEEFAPEVAGKWTMHRCVDRLAADNFVGSKLIYITSRAYIFIMIP